LSFERLCGGCSVLRLTITFTFTFYILRLLLLFYFWCGWPDPTPRITLLLEEAKDLVDGPVLSLAGLGAVPRDAAPFALMDAVDPALRACPHPQGLEQVTIGAALCIGHVRDRSIAAEQLLLGFLFKVALE
jgi:hypothetical protein